MGANCNQAIMIVTDGVPYKYEEIFKTYNFPHKNVRYGNAMNDVVQGCAVSRYSLVRACIEDIFRLGIGLERHIYGCRSVSRVEKIHFAYTNDTFSVLTGFETVSD